MPRIAALLVALLALAACDSSDPADPSSDDPIVGTWALTSAAQTELATVSETQTVLDATGAVTSDVTLSGSEGARLPFSGGVSRYYGGLSFNLFSYDPTQGPFSDPAYTLYVNDQAGYASLQLDVQGSNYVSYAVTTNDPTGLFTRSGWTYRFDAPLTSYDGSERAVRVTGAVTFATRRLDAGRRSVLNEYRTDPGSSYRLSYTFGADGSLVAREGSGNQTIERIGTWVRQGDRVFLRRPTYQVDGTEELEYAMSLRDGTLKLTNDLSSGTCPGYCLRNVEQIYGITPGTLVAYSNAYSTRFEPAAGRPVAALRAEPALAGRPLPPAFRDWLLLGPAR